MTLEELTRNTEKQINVGKLVAEMHNKEMTAKEIANELGIAENLVRRLIARDTR